MQSLEVSGAVRPLYGSLGVKGLTADDEGTPQLRYGHTAAGVTNETMQRQRSTAMKKEQTTG